MLKKEALTAPRSNRQIHPLVQAEFYRMFLMVQKLMQNMWATQFMKASYIRDLQTKHSETHKSLSLAASTLLVLHLGRITKRQFSHYFLERYSTHLKRQLS